MIMIENIYEAMWRFNQKHNRNEIEMMTFRFLN